MVRIARERKARGSTYQTILRKIPKWECPWVHGKPQLLLSVCVNAVQMVGKKGYQCGKFCGSRTELSRNLLCSLAFALQSLPLRTKNPHVLQEMIPSNFPIDVLWKIFSVGKCFLTRLPFVSKRRNGFPRTPPRNGFPCTFSKVR